MLILSGYYWYDATQKQNGQVIKRVKTELFSLMNSKEVGSDLKAFPLLMLERHEKGSIKGYLSGWDAKRRFSQILEIYNVLLGANKHDSSAFKEGLINQAQADFRELMAQKTDYSFLITKLNKFTTFFAFDHYYNPSAVYRKQTSSIF
jgi:hypothetical protein